MGEGGCEAQREGERRRKRWTERVVEERMGNVRRYVMERSGGEKLMIYIQFLYILTIAKHFQIRYYTVH